MRRNSARTLQLVVIFIGILAFIVMIREPLTEGRNLNSTLVETYFKDPFLAYAYTASIAFFVGLYQAFKLIGLIGCNKILSPDSVRALRTMKYSAMLIVAFVVVGEAYLFLARPGDDIAGGVFVGLLVIFVFGVISIVASLFESLLQDAINTKPDSDSAV